MTVNTKKSAITTEQLIALCHFYHNQGDRIAESKVYDLYQKKKETLQHICFCGHFSAGKSTILNRLLDEPLLPQSPIPTSANIVEIKNGANACIIHLTNGKKIKLPDHASLDEVHHFCRNGEEVKKVEIYLDTSKLPSTVTLMDTPGIDAADDADRIMTESALHVVDEVYYVMDYNHVQSEVNATFLKQLKKMNKTFSVIVNQMDKHNEDEIPIAEFKNSLSNVLKQWDIHPKAVYFTSMRNLHATSNDWYALQSMIQSQLRLVKEEEIDETILNSIEALIQNTMNSKKESTSNVITELENELHTLSIDENTPDIDVLKKKIESLTSTKQEMESEYQQIIDQTVKNARITPFELRELAQQMLEAHEAKFKVGIFHSKQKTNEERNKRIIQFHDAIRNETQTKLEWVLRDKLSEYTQKYMNRSINEQVFDKNFEHSTWLSLMTDTVLVTNEYVLVYTDLVASHIKKTYRLYYKSMWNQLKDELESKFNKEIEELKVTLANLKTCQSIKMQIDQEELHMTAYAKKLEELLYHSPIISNEMKYLIQQKNEKHQLIEVGSLPIYTAETNKTNKNETLSVESEEKYSLEKTIQAVNQTIEASQPFSSLTSLIDSIKQKRDRLENRHFTVALFGAFSAGKSSFANALIGEKVLPVSPNPTTAAINKISPPTAEYAHKEVKVITKTEQEILDDVHAIMDTHSFSDLEHVITWLKKKNIEKLSIPDQHKSFLQALAIGYTEMNKHIHSTFTIRMTEFETYVKEESIACYIKEMELFYDCELTKQHVTLVDTPGADSVNARHTELSFSYIKNADAILFVTYYNHPFSKPDKDFLEKLGKVKDAFELDKMFFVVNAIDLAQDDAEMRLVLDYVKQQLVQFEITAPRLFPISSKNTLEEKTNNQVPVNSFFQQLENSFYSFIHEELAQLNMKAIYTDINRIYSLLNNWIHIAESTETERKQFTNKLTNQKSEMQEVVTQFHLSFDSIKQLIEKQYYYIGHRFHIQFSDMFRSIVNPGAIQNNGREGKESLKKSLNALHRKFIDHLYVELEAVNIRLETKWNQETQNLKLQLQESLQEIHPDFTLEELESHKLTVPKIDIQLTRADKLFQKVIKEYKDTATFFARGGRDKVEEEVKDNYETIWNKKLNEIKGTYLYHFTERWQEETNQLRSRFQKEIDDYYDNVLHTSFHTIEDVSKLKEAQKSVEEILH
ncbi:dynamin family protein [Gracilibacillus marinus]|uniref:Dynamin family protein n=1 Tax=Gracilibacillus marinus TaxID=630535 RepID=A0ABV8VWF6_9BACI